MRLCLEDWVIIAWIWDLSRGKMKKICYEIGTVSNKASSVRMETHDTDHRSGLFKSGMMDT